MKKTKAIIFDFDGVIAESMDIKAKGFAFLFKDYPEYVDEIVKFHLAHGGMGRISKFEYIYANFLNKPLSEEEKVKLSEQFSDFVFNEILKCPLVKGAKEFLEKYYKDFDMFVVSGTPDEEIKKIVLERGLEKYFVGIFGSPKKKEQINRELLDKYGYLPQEVVFIGDSIDDYIGVKDLGIRFIGRVQKDDPFKGLDIEGRIKDITELERVLGIKNV